MIAPKPGVYVPTCTFFKNTAEQELDLEAQKKHSIRYINLFTVISPNSSLIFYRLASAGITGIVIQGSNGEAVHLYPEERIEVIKATRSALNENGFPNYPLIAGTGAASLKETLRLTHDVYFFIDLVGETLMRNLGGQCRCGFCHCPTSQLLCCQHVKRRSQVLFHKCQCCPRHLRLDV